MREIAPGAVHLWFADQRDWSLPTLEATCLDWLRPDEAQRYRRYALDRHRLQLLLGRVLLRRVLSEYLAEPDPAALEFIRGEFGKPALGAGLEAAPLAFNLSHSHHRLALAVSRGGQLGVDIEWAAKPRRVARIARRYFSATETTQLLALPEPQWQARFYELWTLKEAYIKARGMGLTLPLQQFSMHLGQAQAIGVEFADALQENPACWQFGQARLAEDYCLSLALCSDAGSAPFEIEGGRLCARQGLMPDDLQLTRRSAS